MLKVQCLSAPIFKSFIFKHNTFFINAFNTDHISSFLIFVYENSIIIHIFIRIFRCIAIDKRGYGDSDKPKGKKNYKVINILDDVRELVLSLGKEDYY